MPPQVFQKPGGARSRFLKKCVPFLRFLEIRNPNIFFNLLFNMNNLLHCLLYCLLQFPQIRTSSTFSEAQAAASTFLEAQTTGPLRSPFLKKNEKCRAVNLVFFQKEPAPFQKARACPARVLKNLAGHALAF